MNSLRSAIYYVGLWISVGVLVSVLTSIPLSNAVKADQTVGKQVFTERQLDDAINTTNVRVAKTVHVENKEVILE